MLSRVLGLVFFANLCFAKSVALFWGGGGEPSSKDSTIFDSDFRAFVPGLVVKGWEVRPLFGKGHFKSEKLVKEMLPHQINGEFTSRKVFQEINRLLLEANSLSRVLLIISSHGLEPIKGNISHKVMATDPKGLDTVDLAEIIDLRDTLEANNIPFSVIDLSCYSGATLELATKKTCVISSSSSQEFSYSTFALELAREMNKGNNFEQAFLTARQQFDDFSSPEISTPENSIIKNKLALSGLSQFPHKNYPYCFSCHIHSHLLKLYEIDLQKWENQIQDNQSESFYRQMQKARDEAQSASKLYGDRTLTFDENEAIKSKSLIQHFFTERQLYRRLYQRIQTQESHPCREWKL